MRALSDRRVAYLSIGQKARQPIEWQQAGFSSFAYRLAHLFLPRPLLLIGIALAFYF